MSKYKITMDGRVYEMEVERMDKTVSVPANPTEIKSNSSDTVVSPMPGMIIKVFPAIGDMVKRGQTVLILEAMKMENEILASKDGRITALHVAQGDTVQGGSVLFDIGE